MIRSAEAMPAEHWPRWWRWSVIALAALVLSACRAPHRAPGPLPNPSATAGPPHGVMLPLEAAQALAAPAPLQPNIPVPAVPIGPWIPPGLAGPWPPGEYLRDGGDYGQPAGVNPDWFVHGVEPEDAIAHYDLLDGRTVVEPSNPVFLYAPRFAAVRQVAGLLEDEQIESTGRVHVPLGIARHDRLDQPLSSLQNQQPVAGRARDAADIFHQRLREGAVSAALLPAQFRDEFLPFEDLLIIRQGTYVQAEKPRLAQAIEAAVVWTRAEAVEVAIDGVAAGEVIGDRRAEAVFTVNAERGPAKLRVLKIASTWSARPGETVDFTLRFDNVGDQLIGNVTLVDNLTPRLEYVAGSAQSSREAGFFVEPNEAGSLVLRWEVADPLPPGEGGIVRFQCVVR